MHDPMTVAFEIRRPWPRRSNFGRTTRWYFPAALTVWHVEPGGRDSGEVCRHYTRVQDASGAWGYRFHHRWRWHVHHWRIQVHWWQRVRRFLFERCIECGQRFGYGYAPVSHQWDGPPKPRLRVSATAFHHECSSLVHLRRTVDGRDHLIRTLADDVRARSFEDVPTMIERLTADTPGRQSDAYRRRVDLAAALGFERDEHGALVPIVNGDADA